MFSLFAHNLVKVAHAVGYYTIGVVLLYLCIPLVKRRNGRRFNFFFLFCRLFVRFRKHGFVRNVVFFGVIDYGYFVLLVENRVVYILLQNFRYALNFTKQIRVISQAVRIAFQRNSALFRKTRCRIQRIRHAFCNESVPYLVVFGQKIVLSEISYDSRKHNAVIPAVAVRYFRAVKKVESVQNLFHGLCGASVTVFAVRIGYVEYEVFVTVAVIIRNAFSALCNSSPLRVPLFKRKAHARVRS